MRTVLKALANAFRKCKAASALYKPWLDSRTDLEALLAFANREAWDIQMLRFSCLCLFFFVDGIASLVGLVWLYVRVAGVATYASFFCTSVLLNPRQDPATSRFEQGED